MVCLILSSITGGVVYFWDDLFSETSADDDDSLSIEETHPPVVVDPFICGKENEECECEGTVYYGRPVGFDELLTGNYVANSGITGTIMCNNKCKKYVW